MMIMIMESADSVQNRYHHDSDDETHHDNDAVDDDSRAGV